MASSRFEDSNYAKKLFHLSSLFYGARRRLSFFLVRVDNDSRFWSDLLLLIAFSSKLILYVVRLNHFFFSWFLVFFLKRLRCPFVFTKNFDVHLFLLKTSMSVKILLIIILLLRFFGFLWTDQFVLICFFLCRAFVNWENTEIFW